MILLSWNCRGLGNPRTVRDLCRMAKEKKPDVVFLIETKCRNAKMEKIRVKLGFECAFVVEAVGKSGGLALLWKEKNFLEIQNYSRWHINAEMVNEEGRGRWKFSGFYGQPAWNKRHESWSLLKHLKSFPPEPWMCCGDFNEILAQHEKSGAANRKETQMEQFREALEACNLSDMGFQGPKFTWNNCRGDDQFTKERLDRVVANNGWLNLFPEFVVQVLETIHSDHKPILVVFSKEKKERIYYRKGFKFEASWQLDEEYQDIVKEAWVAEDGGLNAHQTAQQKLLNCQKKLTRWSMGKFGHAEKILKQKSKKLAMLQQHEGRENLEEIRKLQGEIEYIMEQEDVRWKQRGKQNWYKNGDRNTSFFHAWASHRRKINTIKKIEDEQGREWVEPKEISAAFINFYQQLFTTGGTEGVEQCLEGLQPRVTEDMNTRLLKEFTEAEVDNALAQMHPLKSPGPDGFAACFYVGNGAPRNL
jgi:hypothetical protein